MLEGLKPQAAVRTVNRHWVNINSIDRCRWETGVRDEMAWRRGQACQRHAR